MKTLVGLGLLLTLAAGCGKDDKTDRTVDGANIATDSTLQSEVASANLSEALEAAGDANESATGTTSLDLTSVDFTRDRVCAVDGNNAVVTITSKLSATNSKDLARGTIAQTREESGELKRTWSKTGGAVACGAANQYAAIDFSQDQTGLSLDVAFNRSSSNTFKATSKAGIAVERDSSYTAQGTRSVSWTAHTAGDAGSYTISKTIKSSATRVHKTKNKAGVEESLTLTIATADAAPLAVDVIRDAQDFIASRTIHSGTLVATSTSRVESKFEDLKLLFTADSCTPASGKVTATVFADTTTTTPTAIYEITAADGIYSVSNITDANNPVAVDDFNFELCDIHSFDY